MDHKPSFILSKDDWSLHRKGYQDQVRHQEKVREAIKKNLADLVTGDKEFKQVEGDVSIRWL